jgi:hypothetical protein
VLISLMTFSASVIRILLNLNQREQVHLLVSLPKVLMPPSKMSLITPQQPLRNSKDCTMKLKKLLMALLAKEIYLIPRLMPCNKKLLWMIENQITWPSGLLNSKIFQSRDLEPKKRLMVYTKHWWQPRIH